jgi:hypothetical protein
LRRAPQLFEPNLPTRVDYSFPFRFLDIRRSASQLNIPFDLSVGRWCLRGSARPLTRYCCRDEEFESGLDFATITIVARLRRFFFLAPFFLSARTSSDKLWKAERLLCSTSQRFAIQLIALLRPSEPWFDFTVNHHFGTAPTHSFLPLVFAT